MTITVKASVAPVSILTILVVREVPLPVAKAVTKVPRMATTAVVRAVVRVSVSPVPVATSRVQSALRRARGSMPREDSVESNRKL